MQQSSLFHRLNTPINATHFLSLLGIDPAEIWHNELIRSAVRTDVQTGGLHGLSYLAKKNRQDGYSIKIYHWVRHPSGKDKKTKILHLKSIMDERLGYRLEHAGLFGNKVNFQNETEFYQLLNQLKDILKEIRHHHLPSLKTVVDLQKSVEKGLKVHLEGLDPTGEPIFYPANKEEKTPKFTVPKHILPALLGYHSDIPTAQKPVVSRIASGSELLTFQPFFSEAVIKRAEDGAVNLTVQAWKTTFSHLDEKTEKPVTWFNLKFKPDKKNPDMMKLSKAYCCGKAVNASDTVNIARLCRATATAVHQIRTKETIPSLQQLIQDNGLHEIVNRALAQLKKPLPPQGQMLMNIMGGNNIQDNKFDKGRIGANGYLYSYQKNANEAAEGILVDWGVLFLNRDKDGYDGAMVNPEGVLEHRDPGHEIPKTKIKALVITHAHEDHVGAIPHIIKSGYVLPQIICSQISRSYIEEKMKALGLPKDVWPKFKTVESYQKFKVGPFRLRALPMSHSLPCLAFRIGTAAGSVFHTGDFKMDQTVKAGYPTDMKALKHMHVDAVISDSTSIKREGIATSEQEIENNFYDLFQENPDNRFVVSMLSSNLNRMMSLLTAGAKRGKTIIFSGHALNVSRRIMNTTGFVDPATGKRETLKEYFKLKYNCDILTNQSKRGKTLLKSGSSDALILATGTHNEKLSAMDKMLGWFHKDIEIFPHKDIIIQSQGVIPGGEHAYNKMIQRAEEQGFDVLHANNPKSKGRIFFESGHAKKGDQELFINTVNCQNFIPVHGDLEQLTANADFVTELGKNAVLGNNQTIIEIAKSQVPKIIGHRSEDIVYYKHQRSDDVYYGGAVSYNIDRANPLLSGRLSSLSNIPNLLMNTEHVDEDNYRPQSDVRFSLSIGNNQLSYKLPQSWKVKFDKIIFHDIETTDKNMGEIVQHASITTNSSGTILGSNNFLKRIDDHVLPSPIACMITNTSPYTMREEGRLSPEEFSGSMYQLFYDFSLKKEKVLAVTHNGLIFDNPKIAEDLFKRGFTRTAIANTRGVKSADTLPMSRAAYLYAPESLKTVINDNRPSFRLTDLAMANGLVTDTDGAHDGMFDTNMTRLLLDHLMMNANDITREMLLRTDKNATKDWLLGTGKGMQYRPIVTYMKNSAVGPQAKMGMLANLDLKKSQGNKAVMINLNYNPKMFDTMTPYQISRLLADPHQDVLTLVALNKQPVILPAMYGIDINAHKDVNLRILEQRQEEMLRNPERSKLIADGVDIHLNKWGSHSPAYFLEDYLYPRINTYFEKDAYGRDKKTLKSIEPTVKDLTPEMISMALPYLYHPASITMTQHRLYHLKPELLSIDVQEQIEAEHRLALQAPVNSPKMTMKRYKKEVQEILKEKVFWLEGRDDKRQVLEDLVKFGNEYEHTHAVRPQDEVKAGVSLHKRLTA